jgi:segregation and condensation protein B
LTKKIMAEVNTRKAQFEAILFVAGEAVALDRLAKVLDVSREETEVLAEELRADYAQSSDRGLSLLIHQGTAELVTRPECGAVVAEWTQAEGQESLSKAALEVLATIAYREPITRSGIEAIRGVNCQMTLRNLLLRGLIDRQDEDAVRGYTYTLSSDCLKYLGVTRKEDLPDYETLSRNERLTLLEKTVAGESEEELNVSSNT